MLLIFGRPCKWGVCQDKRSFILAWKFGTLAEEHSSSREEELGCTDLLYIHSKDLCILPFSRFFFLYCYWHHRLSELVQKTSLCYRKGLCWQWGWRFWFPSTVVRYGTGSAYPVQDMIPCNTPSHLCSPFSIFLTILHRSPWSSWLRKLTQEQQRGHYIFPCMCHHFFVCSSIPAKWVGSQVWWHPTDISQKSGEILVPWKTCSVPVW